MLQLENVVPLGRSLDEYREMFLLSEVDLDKSIIGVGDGPASFNAEMAALGKTVVSVDPLYAFTAAEIERQFYAIADLMIERIRATPDDWVWSYHKSPDDLRKHRRQVMMKFVADFETAKTGGRYVVGELPNLDFEDNRFELALCSHFLFIYSDHFTYEFHRSSVLEMLRVASEVRIFPLLTGASRQGRSAAEHAQIAHKVSPYVQPLIEELVSAGYSVGVETVRYEVQKGGNQMIRISTHGQRKA